MQTILPALKLDSEIVQRLKVALVEVDHAEEPEDDETLIEWIEQHQLQDPFTKRIVQLVQAKEQTSKEISLSHCKVKEDALYYQG